MMSNTYESDRNTLRVLRNDCGYSFGGASRSCRDRHSRSSSRIESNIFLILCNTARVWTLPERVLDFVVDELYPVIGFTEPGPHSHLRPARVFCRDAG